MHANKMRDDRSGRRHLDQPSWCRRLGVAAASAAFIAGVGSVVAAPGDPGPGAGGLTGAADRSAGGFSLIATTDWWEPPAPEPQEAAPPPPPPKPAAPAAPRVPAQPAYKPPVQQPVQAAPPPPPPPQLVFRFDQPGTATVAIVNNDKPSVGCTFTSVAVAGTATVIGYRRDYPFTVTGSAETKIAPDGPATGSTFRVTVTCDNGLSSTQDVVF